VTVKSYLKGWDSERVAGKVLKICASMDDLEDMQIVRQLWADREFLMLRLRIVAEGLESEEHHDPAAVAKWAREGYEEVL
jgi:hypothetical protein